MKFIAALLITFLITTLSLSAVFDDYEPSVRARGLSGAFYSLSDDASGVFYNPAGLVRSKEHIALSYARLFNNDFQILKTAAFTMPLPKNIGSIGIGLQAFDVDYFDVNLMSEKVYSLTHAFTLFRDVHSEMNFGYTANLYHLSLDGMGNDTAFGLNLGALAVLHRRTKIGFSVSNINNPKMGKNNQHEIPQRMGMGISYIPYPGVTTVLELKKPFGEETQIHSGAEVTLYELLILRMGIRNQPSSFSTGATFNIRNIMIDYAFNTHTVLNATHHFGVGYSF